MKNENVIKMARTMNGCNSKSERTCKECLAEGKKLFGSKEKCGLIEYATALHKAGYRKQSDTVKKFAEKLKTELFANCVIIHGLYHSGDMDSREAFQIIDELVEKFCKGGSVT